MNLISAISKTEQLADFLREEINKCNSGNGGRILSSRALAKKFNTSQMVARKAFERLEKEGLLESRHGSGTYIKQQTASGKSVAILNEFDISHPETSYFYTRIVQQLRLFFEKRNIPVKLYLGYHSPRITVKKPETPTASDKLIEDINKGVISGIISISGLNTDEWRKPLIASGLPLVGSESGFPNGIDFNRDEFIRMGLDILLGKGCKYPWIITNNESYFNCYLSTVKEKGLTSVPEKLILKGFPKQLPEYFEYSSIMELFAPFAKNKLDGLLFTDDITFKNAMIGILELGLKVPERLQIVAHSNKGSGIFIPFPVTLLEYDPDIVAEKYGLMLVSMLNGKNMTPGRITVTFKRENSLSISEVRQNRSLQECERIKAS